MQLVLKYQNNEIEKKKDSSKILKHIEYVSTVEKS